MTSSSKEYKCRRCKMKKTKGGPIKCELCPGQREVYEGRAGLYRHCSLSHCRSELKNLLRGSKKCPLCGKNFQFSIEAIKHLGVSHSKVEEFLPKKLHIKNGTRLDEKPMSSESPKPKIEGKFACGFCEKSFRKRSDLYDHYGRSHYRKELCSLLGNRDDCPLCNKIFTDRNKIDRSYLIRHFGVVHDQVERFLPEELHLSKIMIRRAAPSPRIKDSANLEALEDSVDNGPSTGSQSN